jgi:hypothetical protein
LLILAVVYYFCSWYLSSMCWISFPFWIWLVSLSKWLAVCGLLCLVGCLWMFASWRDTSSIRLWNFFSPQGDGIHAIIPKGLIAKFQKLIAEGNVYYLQYFETFPVMEQYMEQYRTTPHRFKLRFTARTTVRRIDPVPDGFPFYVYRLRSSLKHIANTVTDKTYLAGNLLLRMNLCTSMSYAL